MLIDFDSHRACAEPLGPVIKVVRPRCAGALHLDTGVGFSAVHIEVETTQNAPLTTPHPSGMTSLPLPPSTADVSHQDQFRRCSDSPLRGDRNSGPALLIGSFPVADYEVQAGASCPGGAEP